MLASNYRPDHEDQEPELMTPPVENIPAQDQVGQPQHLQFAGMGYYDMANDHLSISDHPPLHERRDHASGITNYARVALDVPARARAGPPAPVCADFTFSHTHI